MNMFTRYYRFMSAYGHSSTRDTFMGELNFQSGRFLAFISVAGLAWLSYLNTDLTLHPEQPLILVLRFLVPVLGLSLPLLKMLPQFWHKPIFLLGMFMFVLELATAMITAISGSDPAYIGGFIFILTLMPLSPLPLWANLGNLGITLASYFGVSFALGMDLNNPVTQYSFKDILFASMVSGICTWMVHKLRFRAWKQFNILKEQKKRISKDRERMENLIRSTLPESLAKELKESDAIRPVCFPEVSLVMVQLIAQSTVNHNPLHVLRQQEEVFQALETVLDRYGLLKLKSQVDTCTFALGAPKYCPGHQVKAVLAAQEILELVKLRNTSPFLHNLDIPKGDPSLQDPNLVWEVRIGVNTGEILAASLGNNRFIYDVWGESFITTSKLRAIGPSNHINISDTTWKACQGFFNLEERGPLDGNSAGNHPMYTVVGITQELSQDDECRFPNAEFRDLFASTFNENPARISF